MPGHGTHQCNACPKGQYRLGYGARHAGASGLACLPQPGCTGMPKYFGCFVNGGADTSGTSIVPRITGEQQHCCCLAACLRLWRCARARCCGGRVCPSPADGPSSGTLPLSLHSPARKTNRPTDAPPRPTTTHTHTHAHTYAKHRLPLTHSPTQPTHPQFIPCTCAHTRHVRCCAGHLGGPMSVEQCQAAAYDAGSAFFGMERLVKEATKPAPRELGTFLRPHLPDPAALSMPGCWRGQPVHERACQWVGWDIPPTRPPCSLLPHVLARLVSLALGLALASFARARRCAAQCWVNAMAAPRRHRGRGAKNAGPPVPVAREMDTHT